MFTPPRFVVVDDKKSHLDSIIKTFQKLGSPCVGVHFDPSQDLDPILFRGVRCLFLDLHLVEGQAGTDHRRHFAVIANILETNIHEDGGPFVLVLWTEHAHLGEELRAYLDTSVSDERQHARPFAVLSLAKERFINVDSGAETVPGELSNAVLGVVTGTPQLAALLSWELDVLAAAGSTLASLLSLVPKEHRQGIQYTDAVNTILSRLARETVGRSRVDTDHRAAITAALAPILSDRIMNQTVPESTNKIWRDAVTKHDEKGLEEASPPEAGAINRMLHLALPSSETLRAHDWGAVVELPVAWGDDGMLSRMGIQTAQFLGGELLIERRDRDSCKLVLVRIGAVCDYAQNRKGPVTFLLGAEIPVDISRTRRKGKNDEIGAEMPLPQAVWTSPVFMVGTARPFRLNVHVRFPLNVLEDACHDWSVRYRLREQLLMTLINTSSTYASRPGIVQLPIR